QNGDISAVGSLQSKLQQAEANLPDQNAFTAQTEKQYQSAFQDYFQTLLALGKLKTPEAVQLRNESLARFKAKYQGTEFGREIIANCVQVIGSPSISTSENPSDSAFRPTPIPSQASSASPPESPPVVDTGIPWWIYGIILLSLPIIGCIWYLLRTRKEN
ncbi:MAG TPA: hypothetical protein VGC39_07780, partial [Candidatus Methylacidiphilales bacterium]